MMSRSRFLNVLLGLVLFAPNLGQASADLSTISKEQYTASIKLDGTCYAGKTCRATVTLATKGDYRMHKPLVFKTAEKPPAELAIRQIVNGKSSDTTGTVSIEFTASKSTKLGGTLSVDVDKGSNCLMEKIDLELDVEAK